jgi:ribosomal protein S18 acetylase RimI-like enzyme
MSQFNLGECPVLLQDTNLIYTVLTPRFQKEAFDVISESFCDEPCSVHVEASREVRLPQWQKFAEYFTSECAANDSSIVCIDSTNGNVAGVFWVRDFMNELPDDFSVDDLPCIAPVVEVLIKLDDSYHELRPNLVKGECVDLWMLGVSPNYRRRGIATNLTAVARDWVCTKGYSLVVLEATGAFSAKCAEKAGVYIDSDIDIDIK